MEEKTGIPLVQWAVTSAAQLLSQLKTLRALGDRDRDNCATIQKLLERAEAVLYGRPTVDAGRSGG